MTEFFTIIGLITCCLGTGWLTIFTVQQIFAIVYCELSGDVDVPFSGYLIALIAVVASVFMWAILAKVFLS